MHVQSISTNICNGVNLVKKNENSEVKNTSLPNFKGVQSIRHKSKISVLLFSALAAGAISLCTNILMFAPSLAVILPITKWTNDKIEKGLINKNINSQQKQQTLVTKNFNA